MKPIQLISKSCSDYPQKLSLISESPEIIFAIGNISLLNTFSLAIVGSRNCTFDAKNFTENLVKDLVSQNITIVSGMARGIDTIAHKTCIESGGKTIAILGCGFIHVERQKIFNEILKNDGLIISEYFPDTPPFRFNFPRRNALISGISDGIIVTQAREDSGSLITAKCAIEQNKPLFTFPYNIDNENYTGNNLLLTKGANCIISYKDILKKFSNFKIISNKNIPIKIPVEYRQIYYSLSSSPISINLISQKTTIPINELQYKLTLMELENFVLKHPNNCWSKK